MRAQATVEIKKNKQSDSNICGMGLPVNSHQLLTIGINSRKLSNSKERRSQAVLPNKISYYDILRASRSPSPSSIQSDGKNPEIKAVKFKLSQNEIQKQSILKNMLNTDHQ